MLLLQGAEALTAVLQCMLAFVDSHVFVDPHVEGVGSAGSHSLGEGTQGCGTHTRILIEEQPNLLRAPAQIS